MILSLDALASRVLRAKNSLAPFASAFTRESYEDTLARLVEYLHAGDAYVVNMTQQLSL